MHKPSQEAYRSLTQEFGVEPSSLCLIACHVWDTIGASAAGWQAGLIREMEMLPCASAPADLCRRRP